MSVLFIALTSFVLYIIAYHTYGRFLGRKIFGLCSSRVVPSKELNDGVDYVPSNRFLVLGHHFTSIAGTGPIVGPAIGVIWGWIPALLWVFFGSIFVGAVHDLGSLVVSLRNKGKSIGDVAGILVGPRVRFLFMLVLVLGLTLVLAVFGLVISAVFRQFPSAIFPCIVQIPLAIAVGFWLRKIGRGFLPVCLLSLFLMYLAVALGDVGVLGQFNQSMASLPIWAWTAILLSYCYIASTLPVWALLQPRDFINSLQLISVLGMLVFGLCVAALFGGAPLAGETARPALSIVAPAFQWNPEGAPMIFPFLFITIACGAISGFHSLVSSGTSSKQLADERDAQLVGYGSMLIEGFLATIVILACVAGLGLGLSNASGDILYGVTAWAHNYDNWGSAGGLSSTIGAFVTGASNFLAAMGIPSAFAVALMGVFVASFAATTMDSACRLQRYLIQEVIGSLRGAKHDNIGTSREGPRTIIGFFGGAQGATLLAVGAAGLLAAIPQDGQAWTLANAGHGAMLLWPVFGAINQLIAGIAFILIVFYVRSIGKPVWFLLPPMLFMLIMPLWAMSISLFFGTSADQSWIASGNWPLVFIGSAAIALEIWLIIEAILICCKTQVHTP